MDISNITYLLERNYADTNGDQLKLSTIKTADK